MSSRAQRGICFSLKPEEKADSSRQSRARNDIAAVRSQTRQLSHHVELPAAAPNTISRRAAELSAPASKTRITKTP